MIVCCFQNVLTTAAVKMAEPSSNSGLANDQSNQGLSQQRDERVKSIKDKQNEERQRKLEELKQHAQATQKFREQQEDERRRRQEEQRQRDAERRNQVEERKKAILDAEKERRDAILRRNQERDVRLEMKRRNERGSMAFAFGSSTPRMLEPVSPATVTYWGSRRSTSTTNVMSVSMHGRAVSVDRDAVDENSGTKRAASVFGLDQPAQARRVSQFMSSSMYEVLHWETNDDKEFLNVLPVHSRYSRSPSPRPLIGETLMTQSTSTVLGGVGPDGRRRRTDLMPTVPAHREPLSPAGTSRVGSSRGSISQKTSGHASPDLQSRSMSKSMSHLATPPRRNAPVKTTKTTQPGPVKMNKASPTSMSTSHLALSRAEPPRMTRAERLRQKANLEKNGGRSGDITPASPTRPSSAMSQQSVSSAATSSSVHHLRARTAPASARRPRPTSIAGTGMSVSLYSSQDIATKTSKEKSAEPAAARRVSSGTITRTPRARSADVKATPPPQLPKAAKSQAKTPKSSTKSEEKETEKKPQNTDVPAAEEEAKSPEENVVADDKAAEEVVKAAEPVEEASQPGKKIISSEEEAKAALAEKRRLAREQMEREAEAQRLRVEAELRAEEERRKQEELEQKLAEEEMERLAKEAQIAEQERLQKAIEEAALREEEERQRKEEEQRQKAEKEVAERKLREEAERLRRETEERLRREEEERQERRKRVEAIMSRTRGKGANLPKATSGGEGEKPSTNDVESEKSEPANQETPSENGYAADAANEESATEEKACDWTQNSQPDLIGDVVSKSDSSWIAEKSEALPNELLNNADNVNSNNNADQNDLRQLLA